MSRAYQSVGRLDGVIQTVPTDFFVSVYVRRELAVELEPRPAWRRLPQDVDEVVRYVTP